MFVLYAVKDDRLSHSRLDMPKSSSRGHSVVRGIAYETSLRQRLFQPTPRKLTLSFIVYSM